MTNKIADRLACITALVSRKQEVRHVRLSDGILSVFKWYGVHRYVASRRVTVRPINDELDGIDLTGNTGYTISGTTYVTFTPDIPVPGYTQEFVNPTGYNVTNWRQE